VQLSKAESSPITGFESRHPVRVFLTTCGTFVSNVAERFQEYADARLAEELTVVEQRRRLLTAKPTESARPRLVRQRTAHVD